MVEVGPGDRGHTQHRVGVAVEAGEFGVEGPEGGPGRERPGHGQHLDSIGQIGATLDPGHHRQHRGPLPWIGTEERGGGVVDHSRITPPGPGPEPAGDRPQRLRRHPDQERGIAEHRGDLAAAVGVEGGRPVKVPVAVPPRRFGPPSQHLEQGPFEANLAALPSDQLIGQGLVEQAGHRLVALYDRLQKIVGRRRLPQRAELTGIEPGGVQRPGELQPQLVGQARPPGVRQRGEQLLHHPPLIAGQSAEILGESVSNRTRQHSLIERHRRGINRFGVFRQS